VECLAAVAECTKNQPTAQSLRPDGIFPVVASVSQPGLLKASFGWLHSKWRDVVPFGYVGAKLTQNFAMAYVGLGYTYWKMGERNIENFKKAFDLRDRVTEREKLIIESAYYWTAVGDLEKTVQVLKVLEQTYPRDRWGPYDLSLIYAQLGEHEKALTEAQEAARRDPASGLKLCHPHTGVSQSEPLR